jgi:hypothetical protein
MAEFNSLTFGTISGRHGSAVATTTKNGKSILKVFRKSVDAKTDKQVAHRTKFSYTVAALNPVRDLLNFTFKAKGGYNYGFALAMKNAVKGDPSNFSIDYSQLHFAEGSLVPAKGLVISKLTTGNLQVEWNTSNISDKVTAGAKANEGVNLVLYNETEKEAMFVENCVDRIVGVAEVECPDYWKTNIVHCWIFFSRADGKLNSNSGYVGSQVL